MNHYRIITSTGTIYIQETGASLKVITKENGRYKVDNETDPNRVRSILALYGKQPISEAQFEAEKKKAMDWSVDELKFDNPAKGEPIGGGTLN